MMAIRLAAAAGAALLALAPAAAHADWSKTYVVEWMEPAFHYGATTGQVEKGTDCPAGTNPEVDWNTLLRTSYRTDPEIAVILDPERSTKNAVGGIRGPNRENVYIQPWSVPDPGITPVTGKVAHGFDLDGDPATGFTSVDGKTPGIDNEYYRMAGCWMAWRGPTRNAHHAKYVNEGMRNGTMSILLVVSGKGADPQNDNDVTVGFYMSQDDVVTDANGGIAGDFTFKVDTDQRFQSLIKARTVGGVIESTERADIKMRDIEVAGFFPPQLVLQRGMLRIEPAAGGKLLATVGGYRPIDDYWSGWAGSGTIHESTTHINLVGYWYGLQRKADYQPPGASRRTAISTAYHLYLTPAFLVTPDLKEHITVARLFPPNSVADAAPAGPTAMLDRPAAPGR